jgi:uncharacterized protein YjbJ (UPF0337 family)
MRLNSLAIACAGLIATVGLCACGKSHDGAVQETKGHLESAAGSLTGNDKLKREGKKDEVIGGVKSAVGDLKDAARDATK